MLFRKKIARSCTYCVHCAPMDEDRLICAKKGILCQDSPCHRFQYDPLKRTPPRRKAFDFSKYEQEDYSL